MKTYMQRDYWPTIEWGTAEPADLGMDTKKLLELEPMIKSEYGNNINGITVVRNRYIAFEKYYNGYGPDDTHHVASVTKSIISALVGIAIDKGYIKSVDEKVLTFFPEYVSSPADVQKRTVTIRHLLTMTAPFPFTWKPGGSTLEPLDRLRRQKDWVKYTLDILGQKGKFGEFQYCSAGAHLLSSIITRTTGKCAREFANEHLFSSIGMKVLTEPDMKSFGLENFFGKSLNGWIQDPNGNTNGAWGLTLTPRDMARFGFLYLNNGKWDDNQIIPETWIKDSITSEAWVNGSKIIESFKYGYMWYMYEKNGTFAYMARGDGGNAICCIPEKDLVVAIAAKHTSKPGDILPLLEKCILPSILG